MVAELEASGTSAYPHKYHTTQSIPDFVQAYQGLEPGTKCVTRKGRSAGRREGGLGLLQCLLQHHVRSELFGLLLK